MTSSCQFMFILWIRLEQVQGTPPPNISVYIRSLVPAVLLQGNCVQDKTRVSIAIKNPSIKFEISN